MRGRRLPSVHLDTAAQDDVIVVGYSLSEEEARPLDLPPGEVASRLPRSVLIAAARELGLR
jgi:hypothetical protein